MDIRIVSVHCMHLVQKSKPLAQMMHNMSIFIPIYIYIYAVDGQNPAWVTANLWDQPVNWLARFCPSTAAFAAPTLLGGGCRDDSRVWTKSYSISQSEPKKHSHIDRSSSKTSRSVVSQTTQLGPGAFQLMVVHYVASLSILESTAKGKNQIWHLWICGCKTLVDGNKSSNDRNLDAKRLIFTELVIFSSATFCPHTDSLPNGLQGVVSHCHTASTDHTTFSGKKKTPKRRSDFEKTWKISNSPNLYGWFMMIGYTACICLQSQECKLHFVSALKTSFPLSTPPQWHTLMTNPLAWHWTSPEAQGVGLVLWFKDVCISLWFRIFVLLSPQKSGWLITSLHLTSLHVSNLLNLKQKLILPLTNITIYVFPMCFHCGYLFWARRRLIGIESRSCL